MNHREATHKDLKVIKKLLYTGNLPSEDCDEHINNFIVVENNEEIIAAGGIEVYGKIGLLRSIIVKPGHREQGIGKLIVKLLEGKAHKLGVNELYLLTESTVDFFMMLGYSVVKKFELPIEIKKTRQFKELCPASSKSMRHVIQY
ncbi:MAG: hypothetical protein DIZ80_11180 [endosymbiont of Galathealinum brachiosum]|uniref:Amino-acid acetyltransferase n=1 Tax=endosymbiont of Galathealinum brachiosum TaxID=2200906 RepID=A0A370DEU2_9GAMM|nr:MAG: hypothetical protein DIZ80_11180 [endosymbiont of Galathealinum brachiosum]